MGKKVDLTRMSAHVIVDREARISMIERTIGWGTEIITAPDKKERDATATLTSTGVIIIRSLDGMIITAWVASVPQAVSVWIRGTGNNHLPSWLWNLDFLKKICYNNYRKREKGGRKSMDLLLVKALLYIAKYCVIQ